ncbi:hypothetical protein MMC14_007371 [Varicellaria rhodocarpa]|nr:hypothetical protein [Varicellaria rhodocarpa]
MARNDSDSWLWEHRDYVELDEEKKRLRLHVPLITNPKYIIHFSHFTVFMAPGWIWKLDPTVSHAISNTSIDSRTHLILDCYKNRTLRKMLSSEMLEAEHMQPLPLLDAEERRKLLTQAQNLFTRGSEKAEAHLLKAFHKFDLGKETSYDLLIDLYREMGFRTRENYWITEQITRIYHRDKINPILQWGIYAARYSQIHMHRPVICYNFASFDKFYEPAANIPDLNMPMCVARWRVATPILIPTSTCSALSHPKSSPPSLNRWMQAFRSSIIL